jgi:hypothetical protein
MMLQTVGPAGRFGGTSPLDDAKEAAHNKKYHDLMEVHLELMKAHRDLLGSHKELTTMKKNQHAHYFAPTVPMMKPAAPTQNVGLAAAACLGVVRLDYDYPPAPGDIDCPKSYAYDVFYRVVPGLTFDMCQSGKMTGNVEKEFEEAIDWLVAKGVSGITGDCGFMMYFQALARRHTTLPVFMSSLCQLPAITCGFNHQELIAIFTANNKTLAPMRGILKDECGVDPDERRFVIVGCNNVDGFDAVEKGEKVDVEHVTPGMIKLAKENLLKYPKIRAILLECTELPPYADALRAATRLPVYDAITSCNMFMAGRQDNPLFGLNSWQNSWDGKQDDYHFGANLDKGDRAKLVNKMH